ncbi:MAG TPA: S8 family peptidase [Clostridia bacterium]|nr:S8 family peptidase [Clostridia bacterium]
MAKNKKMFTAVLLAIFTAVSSIYIGYSVFSAKNDTPPPGRDKTEIIVKYKNINKSASVQSNVKSKLKLSKMKVKKKFNKNRTELVEISSGDDINKTIAELKKDPSVEYAQPNYKMDMFAASNPVGAYQWTTYSQSSAIDSEPGDFGYDIDLPQAWDITKGSKNVIVAITDTEVDITHRDLSQNIWTNKDEKPGNGIDDDGNGYIDDTQGWDFFNSDKTVFDTTGDTHGTQVAGIISANNKKGLTGIAPGVKILPLKFMQGNVGYTSDALEAIEYAEKEGASIMNCSWGSADPNVALLDTMKNSKMLFVCAAGNNGNDSPVYPAAFGLKNILSVTAVSKGPSGEFIPYYANYGKYVDLAAPGSYIPSTCPGNSYCKASGTSMAAPFVAGTAALIKSVEPGITADELASRIKRNVRKEDSFRFLVNSEGKLDVYNAVNNTVKKEDVTAPTPDDATVYGILHKIKKFSEASQEEKDLISRYFKVPVDLILKCEFLGCDLDTSINTAMISYRYSFSPEEILSLRKLYKDDKELTNELESFKLFIASFSASESNIAILKEYLMKGYTADEISSAYVVSEALKGDIAQYITKEIITDSKAVLSSKGIKLSGEEKSVLDKLLKFYTINISTLLDYYKSSQKSISEIFNIIRTYEEKNKKQCIINGDGTVTPLETTLTEVKFDKYNNAPFKLHANDKESVSPVNGSLSYQSTDMHFEGRNGLDLDIATGYNTSDSNLYEPKISGGVQYRYRVQYYELNVVTYTDGSGRSDVETNRFGPYTQDFYDEYSADDFINQKKFN